MKKLVIMSSVLIAVLCCLIGCDSKLGGDIEQHQGASVPNEIVKHDMQNYINPSESVYK